MGGKIWVKGKQNAIRAGERKHRATGEYVWEKTAKREDHQT